MGTPEDELLRWREAAPGWIAHASLIASMTTAVSRALIGQLTPRPGETLLDLACGAGDPALGLSDASAGRARVVAMDPVHELAAATQLAAAARDVPVMNARAEQLPFGEAHFDGASCRFGAMFFQPVEAGLRELHRVLKPGGRLALAVWGPREHNPYFTTVARALELAGVPAPPSAPDQPTVFELARPGDLASRLEGAGFREVQTLEVPFEMALSGATPETFMQRQGEVSSGIRERLESITPTQREAAAALTASAVEGWARDGAVALPALALVISARR